MKRTTHTLRSMQPAIFEVLKSAISMLHRLRIAMLVAFCLGGTLLPSGCQFAVFHADLAIHVAQSDEIVVVEDDLTYTITVTDNFPLQTNIQYSVVQTFSQPVEIISVSVSVTDASTRCSHMLNTVTCITETADITPEMADFTITVVIRAITPGVLKTTASIQGLRLAGDGAGVRDINLDNDTAMATANIAEVSGVGLSWTVTDNPDPVSIGASLTYTITINNVGTEPAPDVIMRDKLPAEVVDITPDQTNCVQEDGNNRACEFGTIPVGESRTTTIVVSPTQAVLLTNVVSVSTAGVPAGQPVTETTRVILTAADLSVSILDNPDPVSIGNELTYNITVRNHGPLVDISPPSLTFVVGPGVTFSYAVSNQGSCSLAGSIVTCDLDLTATNQDCPNCAMVTVGLRPSQAGTLTATAAVSIAGGPDFIDPDLLNNTATETTLVTEAQADLAVATTDTPDPVAVGNSLSYRVDVINNGPATATNALVTDNLPANVDVVSVTPSQGSCTATGLVATCNLGALASGARANLVFVVRPQVAGTISNTARVTATESDPSVANNSATESTTVNEALVPDLSVMVSDSPDPVVVNQPLTYTITVRNNGFGAANGFTITATLPSSVTANSTPDFQCSTDTSGNLVCQAVRGGLDTGDEISVSLVATPTAVGVLSNTVTVSLTQTDPNPGDNSVTAMTEVRPPEPTADVSISISDLPDPVAVNQPVTYTFTVTNHGLATATGITATAYLPSSLIADPTSCTPQGGDIVCRLSGPFTLGNGQSTEFTLSAIPTAPGLITVSAEAFANETDPDTSNNSARQMTDVQPPPSTADLEIVSVTDSPDPWVVDDQFTYTITVRNNGLADATGVTVTNTLPATVSSDGSLDCATGNGPVIQCLVGNMSSGSTRTILLRARSSLPGTVTNNVSVSAQEIDPDSSNNTHSESTTIYPADSADVSVTMTATPNPVVRLGVVTFTIVVQNTGPRTATGVSLSGFSKATLEIGAILPTQGMCSQTATSISCDVGALANGGSATVTIVAIPHFTGILDRTITATTSSNDPNPANNTASVSITVN